MSTGWLKRFEVAYLDEDNEWNLVVQDIADLMRSYASHPATSDVEEYAARAVGFCVRHMEREAEEVSNSSDDHANTKSEGVS